MNFDNAGDEVFEENSDISEDEDDSESEVSSAESEEGGNQPKKNMAKTGRRNDEETGPPHTKHELDVLPRVPEVTALLEPHHKPVSVGHIASLLDLTIIVESTSNQKVLNEKSILWLTESRVALGIIDEVFGPVQKPFYLVRFNQTSEIPKDVRTGLDVSYVLEFSEFVLKDNPSLYKKAVDASGLDDEELGSEEEFEFSDDEKEAEAHSRERSKRGLDNKEKVYSQDWNAAVSQPSHSNGQRRGRGRGRSLHGINGSTTPKAVDTAVDFVAGLDLKGSQFSSESGRVIQQGRGRNRQGSARPNFHRNLGRQELQFRGPRTGPGNGCRSPSQHGEFSQMGDQREKVHSDLARQQTCQTSHVLGVVPCIAGAVPAYVQGLAIHAQQLNSGFQPFGYNNVLGYGTYGQSNFLSTPNCPRFTPNPIVFNNPGLNLNPQFDNQGPTPMNIVHNQLHVSNIYGVQMNCHLHGSLQASQAGGHPSQAGFLHPASMGDGGIILPNYGLSAPPRISQNVQIEGPVFAGRDSRSAQGHQRSFANNRGWQVQ